MLQKFLFLNACIFFVTQTQSNAQYFLSLSKLGLFHTKLQTLETINENFISVEGQSTYTDKQINLGDTFLLQFGKHCRGQQDRWSIFLGHGRYHYELESKRQNIDNLLADKSIAINDYATTRLFNRSTLGIGFVKDKRIAVLAVGTQLRLAYQSSIWYTYRFSDDVYKKAVYSLSDYTGIELRPKKIYEDVYTRKYARSILLCSGINLYFTKRLGSVELGFGLYPHIATGFVFGKPSSLEKRVIYYADKPSITQNIISKNSSSTRVNYGIVPWVQTNLSIVYFLSK
jgi:hypothetical protein